MPIFSMITRVRRARKWEPISTRKRGSVQAKKITRALSCDFQFPAILRSAVAPEAFAFQRSIPRV